MRRAGYRTRRIGPGLFQDGAADPTGSPPGWGEWHDLRKDWTEMTSAMTRVVLTLLLAVLLGTALAATASAASPTPQRPNVLVIMTDDQALTDLQSMPNVQKLLVRQGTSFSNAITSFPLCCPSRASFLTGQFAHNHGVSGNFAPKGYYGLKGRDNTLPVWLKRSGYFTSLIGKYLNGYGARDEREIPPGYTDWHGALDLSAYDYYNFKINENGKLRTWGSKTYADKMIEMARVVDSQVIKNLGQLLQTFARIFTPGDFGTKVAKNYTNDVTAGITDKVIRGRAKSDDPWFVWWAPAAPHREDINSQRGAPWGDPRPAPRDEAFALKQKLPRPPSFDEADDADKPSLIAALPRFTDPVLARLTANYQGRIGALQSVDRGVAKLLATLKQTGQDENTIVVFTSDNGWVQGEHGIAGDKFVPYEESLRVPLIMRGPGIPAGRVVDRQVSNIDLTPTFLDIAGATPGRVMDGLSLMPFAKSPKSAPERALPIEATGKLFVAEGFPQDYDRPYSGIRTDRFKYVKWSYGPIELYDLRKDPYELKNLAAVPAYASTVKTLEAQRKRLAKCRGAACNKIR
jgi:N-acetylglucosamine-6-sulfatase